MQLQEIYRNSHRHRQKRNKHREGHRQNHKIHHRRGQSRPKSGVPRRLAGRNLPAHNVCLRLQGALSVARQPRNPSPPLRQKGEVTLLRRKVVVVTDRPRDLPRPILILPQRNETPLADRFRIVMTGMMEPMHAQLHRSITLHVMVL